MKALTDQVYVDDIEAEEEGIAEAVMDNDTIAQVARPGTSLRTPSTAIGGPNQGLRYKKSLEYRYLNTCVLVSVIRYVIKCLGMCIISLTVNLENDENCLLET